ncbi:MAG: glycosyltransferase family 2 protein [Chitinophagaceae bacterium]
MNCKVAIVILNWNTSGVTVECLESLSKVVYGDFHVFLVDNASKDTEYEHIKRYVQGNKQFTLISLAYNYGFAEGNNIGIRIAEKQYAPDYFLLLNNDTVVDAHFLQNLVDAAQENPKIGIAVPKIFFFEPSDRLYYAGGYINKLSGMGEHYGWQKKDNNQYGITKNVSFANGCCMLITSKLYHEIGGLNRDFFANIEDVEYSYRCTRSDFGIIYVPTAIVIHKEGYASKRNKGQWFRIYLSTRNLILFYKERTEWYKLLLFIPYFTIRWITYMTLKLMIMRDYQSVNAVFRGVRDGWKNRLSFVELPKETIFRKQK